MSSFTQLLYPLPVTVSSQSLSSLQTHQPPTTLHKHTPLLNHSTSPPKPISHSRSLTSWVESLRFQVRSNLFREAILTYIDMTIMGVPLDNFVFPAVLKAVASLQDLNLGRCAWGSISSRLVYWNYNLTSQILTRHQTSLQNFLCLFHISIMIVLSCYGTID